MGFKYHVKKGYDGGNILKWNLEIKPFIVRWIVQTKEDMCKLGGVEIHMSPWNVARMDICFKFGPKFMAKMNKHPWTH
jgi:hypothetical protein